MLDTREPIKVILKFSLQKIYEMYYYSEMELPEIILLAETSSHVAYNKDVFVNLSEKGSILFNQKWLQNKELIRGIVKLSEKRQYYNDSVVGVCDLVENIDSKAFRNDNSKLFFSILIILTKINEL